MVDCLAAVCASVCDESEALSQAFQMSQQWCVRFQGVGGRRDVFFGDDEYMRGRNRMEVTEGKALVVLVDLGGRDGSRSDAAEDAVSSHEEQCRTGGTR